MPVNPKLTSGCDHGCGGICEVVFGTRMFNVTCLATPLQIDGHVDGVRFYFRARHDAWRLELPDFTDEVIGSGDGDEFTPGQAADLIVQVMNLWLYPGSPIS